MIFIYISSYCKKHKFFIYLIWRTIIKASEIFILFNISEMTFCLNRACLSFQNAFFTLYISMWLLSKLFSYFINLHYFILINIFIRIIFIQAFRLMFTSAAVQTSIYFICLCITVLFFSFLCWYVSVHDCHDRYRPVRPQTPLSSCCSIFLYLCCKLLFFAFHDPVVSILFFFRYNRFFSLQ